MPIDNFSGETYVAFVDVSGMKELAKQGKGAKVLADFYETGYSILKHQAEAESTVEGIFVSDCAILFSAGHNRRPTSEGDNPSLLRKRLIDLLRVVKSLNRAMVSKGWMLTTSIAYGEFVYEDRIVFRGITKNSVFGGAYFKAYQDNDHGSPKMEPGQCRIVFDNLPNEIVMSLDSGECADSEFRLLWSRSRSTQQHPKHFYYYWMASEREDIPGINDSYKKADRAKYDALLRTLRDASLSAQSRDGLRELT